jgi:hypothetical protein
MRNAGPADNGRPDCGSIRPMSATAPRRLPTLLFALTIFVSAFLLFQVQPMVGKFILPWFGGSPAVWTTAMLFFQSVLFAGYLYAHLLGSGRSPRVQAAVHLALLAAAAWAAAWVLPDAGLAPTGDEAPVARILLILAASVGLPYFCLATTGPLVQHWFAQSGGGGSAFRLYALSNVGSFVALLSFPYLFEPWFELPTIGRMWTAGFWVFALLCATLALGLARPAAPTGGDAPGPAPAATSPPSIAQRVRWVALPALASLAFIAFTDRVSHDIAPEPRLWTTTLALYLLTFVLAFDHPRWYRPRWTALACIVTVTWLAGRDAIPRAFGLDWDYGVGAMRWMHHAAMFAVCLLCHGELYRQRPEDTRHLTGFYLWMSFGGACGGLFVALVATHLFDDYLEWPLVLAAALALACAVFVRDARAPRALAPLAGVVLIGLILVWEDPLQWRDRSSTERTVVRLDQARNFYGTVSVEERRYPADPSRDHRVFFSGQITHGIQYLAPDKRRLPVTYYGEDSGIGETLRYVMARQPSARVALVGLGAGTLATYARAADRYDFFEINPDAVRIAQTWFDNVASCRAAEKRMIVGDARLKIAGLPADVRYDVIVLDAFTGGSVPVHLLTREAFEIYRRHLAPDGFIAINITNAYLNLYPVVRRQAETLGLGFRNRYQDPDPARHIRRNQHFVMTADAEYLRTHPSVNRRWFDAQGRLLRTEDLERPGVPLWTDHFSSLAGIEWDD